MLAFAREKLDVLVDRWPFVRRSMTCPRALSTRLSVARAFDCWTWLQRVRYMNDHITYGFLDKGIRSRTGHLCLVRQISSPHSTVFQGLKGQRVRYPIIVGNKRPVAIVTLAIDPGVPSVLSSLVTLPRDLHGSPFVRARSMRPAWSRVRSATNIRERHYPMLFLGLSHS